MTRIGCTAEAGRAADCGSSARSLAKDFLKEAAGAQGLRRGSDAYRRFVDIHSAQGQALLADIDHARESEDPSVYEDVVERQYQALTGASDAEIEAARVLQSGPAQLGQADLADATGPVAASDDPNTIVITGHRVTGLDYAIHRLADPLAIRSGNFALNLANRANEAIENIPGARAAVTLIDWGLKIAGGPVRLAIGEAVGAVSQQAVQRLTGRFEEAGYTQANAVAGGIGGPLLLALGSQGVGGALKLAKRFGFQDHHIVSPLNRAVSGHPLIGLAGYNLESRANKILLPRLESLHPTRSVHNGRHVQAYSNRLRDRMNGIVEDGQRLGYTQNDYRKALNDVIVEERNLLRSGERALNKNARPGAR